MNIPIFFFFSPCVILKVNILRRFSYIWIVISPDFVCSNDFLNFCLCAFSLFFFSSGGGGGGGGGGGPSCPNQYTGWQNLEWTLVPVCVCVFLLQVTSQQEDGQAI